MQYLSGDARFTSPLYLFCREIVYLGIWLHCSLPEVLVFPLSGVEPSVVLPSDVREIPLDHSLPPHKGILAVSYVILKKVIWLKIRINNYKFLFLLKFDLKQQLAL
jgi:hypothetical protein